MNPSAAATAMTMLACSDRSDGSLVGDALIALPGWQVCEATHDGFEQSLMSNCVISVNSVACVSGARLGWASERSVATLANRCCAGRLLGRPFTYSEAVC